MSDRKRNPYGRVSAATWVRLPMLRALFYALVLSVEHCAEAQEQNAAAKQLDLTQLPLETLMQMDVPTVSSPSKFEQKETEAPASVTVISAKDIQQYGYRTLADVLNSVQGF